ncbi:MAG: hypothetical protein J5691_01295 [Bacilli bacterium]|nr:hypothetical protein [Bacilli bacterium]
MDYGIQTTFMNKVLDDYFSGRSNYDIYIGLGLSNEGGNANMNDFIEPDVAAGYAKQPFVCSRAVDGVAYNANEIVFNTASADWTTGGRVIDKVGLFNRDVTVNSLGEEVETYTLWCVLPLVPSETVITGDTVIINTNAIRLQLTNK